MNETASHTGSCGCDHCRHRRRRRFTSDAGGILLFSGPGGETRVRLEVDHIAITTRGYSIGWRRA